MRHQRCKCIKCVVTCLHCEGHCILHGKTASGNIRYRCKKCGKTQVAGYHYKAYNRRTNNEIVALLKEQCGIRSIARLLHITTGTVLRRIVKIADSTQKPTTAPGKVYELDEVCTYVQRKSNQQWIIYALQSDLWIEPFPKNNFTW
ncbi:IS1/IS1595 family N-terminal zinc-binding domain-containing protein [Chitinophagaceae bacterium MMS25-I14]